MQQHLIMQMLQQQQQQQQLPPNITTEHIQQYLDENKTLIMKILESQNLGKFSECAEYQARLQRNLMYLATIADCQPPAPTHSQFAPNTVAQPGTFAQQSAMFTRLPMAYAQQQQQYSTLQEQQFLHDQLTMASGGRSRTCMPPSDDSKGGTIRTFADIGHTSTGEGLQVVNQQISGMRGAGSAGSRELN